MRLGVLSLFFFFFILNYTVLVLAPPEESSMHIHAIGWDGKDWLIGGRVLPDGPTFLVMYIGGEFTDITPTELRDMWIENVSWTGREWVIREMENVLGSKNRIYTYDGKTFKLVGRNIRETTRKEFYKACSEDYCLIWNKTSGKLLKYDGKNYTDLTKESGIQSPFESVIIMVWNSEYWLIGIGGTEGGGVLRYDGKSFASLSLPHPTAANAIVWNDDYWLIGTIASPRFSGSLIRYNGVTFVDLTPQLKSALEIQPTTTTTTAPISKPKPFLSSERIIMLIGVVLIIPLILFLVRIKRKTS